MSPILATGCLCFSNTGLCIGCVSEQSVFTDKGKYWFAYSPPIQRWLDRGQVELESIYLKHMLQNAWYRILQYKSVSEG